MATGHVYFIQWKGGGPVKIGWALDPGKRLVELQCGSPVDLVLVDWHPGSVQLEKSLHKRLRPYKIRGEWYIAAPSMRETIRRALGRIALLSDLKLGKRSKADRSSLCDGCLEVLEKRTTPQITTEVRDRAQRIAAGLSAKAEVAAMPELPRNAYLVRWLERKRAEKAALSEPSDA